MLYFAVLQVNYIFLILPQPVSPWTHTDTAGATKAEKREIFYPKKYLYLLIFFYLFCLFKKLNFEKWRNFYLLPLFAVGGRQCLIYRTYIHAHVYMFTMHISYILYMHIYVSNIYPYIFKGEKDFHWKLTFVFLRSMQFSRF